METVALKYSGDSGSIVLNELLEPCRSIKRLVLGYGINASFETSILSKSVEWLEVPNTFPSLRALNLENIVKLRISVEQLKYWKFKGIAKIERLDNR
jgi:hypothetical protein